MGWRPCDVLICTPFEFWSAWDGWRDANSSPEPEPMLRAELDQLIREHKLDGG